MAKSNFERMIEMAEEVFDVRHDPEQLNVNEKVIAHLHSLHPATVSEYDDGHGPAVWILLIPTTQTLMQQFLDSRINEQQLADLTKPGIPYTCIYLCSAMVLPEHRGKGIAKHLTLEAIQNIRATNPITQLFVWPFSKEGAALAQRVAEESGLELLVKTSA